MPTTHTNDWQARIDHELQQRREHEGQKDSEPQRMDFDAALARVSQPLTPEQEAHRQAKLDRQAAVERSEWHMRPVLDSVHERYHGATLDNFDLYHRTQRPVINRIRIFRDSIVKHTKQGHGMVLFGGSGTGKDHLACALLLHAAREHSMRCRRVSGRALQTIDYDAADGLLERLTSKAYQIVLVSDPAPSSGYQFDRLYRLVDERADRRLATWLTVNVKNRTEGEDLLSKAIFDRFLFDAAVAEFFNWPSYREEGAKPHIAKVEED